MVTSKERELQTRIEVLENNQLKFAQQLTAQVELTNRLIAVVGKVTDQVHFLSNKNAQTKNTN